MQMTHPWKREPVKIRTRFTIILVLFGITLITVAASFFATNRQVERLQKQEAIAHDIELGARELSYLSNDYLLNCESRQRTRWEAKFSSFSNVLSGLTPDDPEQAALVNDIELNQQRLKSAFAEVVSTLNGRSPPQGEVTDMAFIRVSWSRMEVQNQGMALDASRLAQMFKAEADRLRQRNIILIFVLIGVFGAFLVIEHTSVHRRITGAISDLQAATRIIGSGNLEFAIEEKKADEIGELSRAFNRMTAGLRAITASKADLEQEVADRKRAQDALRLAKEELAHTNSQLEEALLRAGKMARKAESAILANMSHEIRTPMNSVMGMTGLLLDTKLAPDQRECAEIVRSSADALLGIVNDMLDLSKIEAGRMELEVLDFDLRRVLEEVCDALAVQAREKNLELVCLLPPEVPTLLRGDSGRLRQILLNLLGNGVKFTSEGEVSLQVGLECRDERGALIRFLVTDTGAGITKDRQRELFQPFSQADSSVSRRYSGTGLGLSICKGLVEMLDGEIGVESEEGKGATFRFTARFEEQDQDTKEHGPPVREEMEKLAGRRILVVDDNAAIRISPAPPLEKGDACSSPSLQEVDGKGSSATSSMPSEEATSRVRILVVEDNVHNRKVAIKYLEKLGYSADAVSDGREALEALELTPYDLVLMDCRMPVMDGYEATRRIRDPHSKVRNRNVPIVAMTASAITGDRKKCIEAGMNDYLPKLVDPEELARVLQRWAPCRGDEPASPAAGEDVIVGMNEDGSFPSSPVLMVDDDPQAMRSLNLMLRSGGITNIIECRDSRKVMDLLSEREVGVMLLDLSMPYLSGEQILPMVVDRHPEVPVIIITGTNEVDIAVQCIKSGAFDYVVKPVEKNRLVSGVRNAIQLKNLEQENRMLRERVLSTRLEHPEAFAEIVTGSERMRSIFKYVEAVAPGMQPVLITGETGTGKELMARAIHKLSGRKGTFLAVNVAGLDDHLFCDNLFGHAKGAFTGASGARKGMIENARGGTLFLDEIGDLSGTSQVKLLRLLQEGEYFPLGVDSPRRSDARILLATNQDLQSMVEAGSFRKDLYFRIQSHLVRIPPLSERLEDLPLLADFFLGEAALHFDKKKPTPPKELLTLLRAHHFPGNIRELRSLIYDAVGAHKSGQLSLELIKSRIEQKRVSHRASNWQMLEDGDAMIVFSNRLPTLKQASLLLIDEAMKRMDGNQTQVARFLGVTRQTLTRYLKLRNADAPPTKTDK